MKNIAGEAFELMEQCEGSPDDLAESVQALDVRSALAGDHRHDPATPQLTPYALSPRTDSGRRLGRPGRPATGGIPATRARVSVMSLTLAAVVMTCNGVPRPSQTKRCLLPVFRRFRAFWEIERTIAWLFGYYRLTHRHGRKGEHFLAFLDLAAALACYKKLAKPST